MVVGDEVAMGFEGKQVDGVIVGAMVNYKSITGTAGATLNKMEGTSIPIDIVFDIKRQ